MKEESVLLECVNVMKQYPSGDDRESPPVLNGVDLRIHDGEPIAVIGPSGSGKSTLLNMMGALDRPTSGEVRLSGQALSRLPDKTLSMIRNREIGFIFQLHHLLPQCTVLENVLIPTIPYGKNRSENSLERAMHLLERVGLADHMHKRPGQLSGGECQRTAVVRALINRPRLLLADEPTGSLDGSTADRLARLLVELNREDRIALVVVTHSLSLANRLGKRFRLQNGILKPDNGQPEAR